MKTKYEAIIDFVSLRGPDNKIFWYTHGKIKEGIKDNEKSLSGYLLKLVKDGYIERTFKPEGMKGKYNAQKEYLYRWTGKPYRIPNYEGLVTHHPGHKENLKLGRLLAYQYPYLPKWFRKMMLN